MVYFPSMFQSKISHGLWENMRITLVPTSLKVWICSKISMVANFFELLSKNICIWSTKTKISNENSTLILMINGANVQIVQICLLYNLTFNYIKVTGKNLILINFPQLDLLLMSIYLSHFIIYCQYLYDIRLIWKKAWISSFPLCRRPKFPPIYIYLPRDGPYTA